MFYKILSLILLTAPLAAISQTPTTSGWNIIIFMNIMKALKNGLKKDIQ